MLAIEPADQREHLVSKSLGSIRAKARRASAPWAGRASRVRSPASAARRLTARWRAGWWRVARLGKRSYISAISAATACRQRAMYAPIRKFSWTVRVITMRRPSGTSTSPPRTRALVDNRGDVAAIEHHAPTGSPDHSQNRAQQRRFAGAIGAEHRHGLSCVQPQRHAAHRVHAAVADIEVMHSSCTVTLHGSSGRRAEIVSCTAELRRISSGLPSAILRPNRETITSSHSAPIKCMSCSTTIKVRSYARADVLELRLQRIGFRRH